MEKNKKNSGNSFRDAVVNYINSWGENLVILKEVNVGMRWLGTPRKLDIVVQNADQPSKTVGIECKYQGTAGSAFEKIPYAMNDLQKAPIPTLLVIGGSEIKDDVKSQVITSGMGYELGYSPESGAITDDKLMFKQRVFIELGMDWIKFATGDNMKEQKKSTENQDELFS